MIGPAMIGRSDDRSRDDRSRDGRGTVGRRSTQPARPAWDAATYGTPDDMRRARPPASPRGRGGNPDSGYSDSGYSDGDSDGGSRAGSDPYRSAYPAEPYPPSTPYPGFPVEPYPAEGYSSDPGRPLSTYPESRYPAASSAPPYAPETYAPDMYSSDKYAADPYPSDRYSASMYAPDPESDPYGSSAYPSDPYPASSYSPDPFPANQPSSGSPGFDPHQVDPAAGDRSAGDLSAGHREQGGGDPTRRYPGGSPDEAGTDAPQPSGRAGRNLPAAIGVGVLLGGIAVGSLFFWRPAFLVVLVAAVGIGSWELVRAIRGAGANPPLIPLLVGGGLMMGLAWWGHADALTFGLMVTVLAAMVWRLADGSGNYGRDVTAATLVAVYVPFLAGFAALLATPPDGDLRVLVTLAGVVLSDTGGYIAGVLFGKHAMAPTVSPKKSWEGLAGSLVATGVGGSAAALLPVRCVVRLGCDVRAGRVGRRGAGRSRRVDDQAGSRGQGHESTATRAWRSHGPNGFHRFSRSYRVRTARRVGAAAVIVRRLCYEVVAPTANPRIGPIRPGADVRERGTLAVS